MLFQADLDGRQEPVSNGEQSRLTVAMTTPIDRNGFEASIDGREMGTGGDADLGEELLDLQL